MDYETLFVVLVSVFLIQSVVLYQSWLQNQNEIGIRDWAIAGVLLSIASLLLTIDAFAGESDASPRMETTMLIIKSIGNVFSISGYFLVFIGIQHFFQQPALSHQKALYIALALGGIMLLENIIQTPEGWRLFVVSA